MKILDVVFDQTSQSFTNPCGTSSFIVKEGTGTFKKSIPLSAVTESSIRIDQSVEISIHDLNIGMYSFEEEPFFISFNAFFPEAFSTEEKFLYDINSDLGFSIKDGNIIFSVKDLDTTKHSIYYKLPNIGISYSIIGSYSEKTISLYVDGKLVASKQLGSEFKFMSDNNLTLDSSVSTSYILLDKIEVYKDKLSSQIINSILSYRTLPQNINSIITSDNPVYFSTRRDKKTLSHAMVYGINKDFSTATLTGLKLNSYNEVIIDAESGPASGTIEDSHFFPPVSDPDHNQIMWSFNNEGVSVEYSFDGITYSQAFNGLNIPGFSGGMIYYRITLSTTDIAKNAPVFTGMSIICYLDKTLSADNYLASLTTDYNYTVGKTNLPIIYYSSDTGIKTISGGIRYNSSNSRSIEFLFRPSGLGQTCLVDCLDARYSWSAAGNITKSNISSVYVNGVNVTSKTAVSEVFDINTWYHVFITFSANKAGDLFLNQSQSASMIGSNNNYSNIAIYSYDASEKAIDHYKYITGSPSAETVSDAINIGSDSFEGYNVDVLLLSTQ